jgi:NADH:ubiquinone oxidoreductase subunit F (NADH-binding)
VVLDASERYLLPPEPIRTMADYRAWGGGGGVERAVALGPEATRAEIAASGLRGRGGGGFPTGRKWDTIATDASPRAVVVNGAEGEPATFKDRALLRTNAHQVVEGAVIAAFAVGAQQAYIAVKATFEPERQALEQAVAQLQEAGVCADCSIGIVAGPGDYLFGEETALLEVVQGGAPLPRTTPPYVEGLFATPTQPTVALVNNVETLAHAAAILARGADWFRGRGTQGTPGHTIATIVGDVLHPAVGELPMGTPLAEAIEAIGGGPNPGRRVKAVLPGVANGVLTADLLSTPLSFEHLAAAGSGLGAAGFTVLDDSACMVQFARQASSFLAIESCGQCPPCKLGSTAITGLLDDLESGRADGTTLDRIAAELERVTDANRCYLGTQEKVVVTSILQRFPEEVADHLAGPCPNQRPVVLPTRLDLPIR